MVMHVNAHHHATEIERLQLAYAQAVARYNTGKGDYASVITARSAVMAALKRHEKTDRKVQYGPRS